MSEYRQSHTVDVNGSIEDCFAVLIAFEDYPRWAAPIQSCRIVEHYPDGLPKRVAFELDMTIKTIRYVLEYTYDRPHGATWRLVEGDVKGVDGSYRFESAGAATSATCTQAIDIGFWVPGFLRSVAEQKALRDSVEAFRGAVEERRSA